jgi:hypothetical protein
MFDTAGNLKKWFLNGEFIFPSRMGEDGAQGLAQTLVRA